VCDTRAQIQTLAYARQALYLRATSLALVLTFFGGGGAVVGFELRA
jgi:hypothetical protein